MLRIFILTISSLVCIAASAVTRRVTDRFSRILVSTADEAIADPYLRGAIAITSAEGDSAGLSLGVVAFSGFDKPASGDKESFLVTNHAPRGLMGIEVEITYLTPDGRQIHRRNVKVKVSVPPGETRKVDVKSFDTQHSYHYSGSSAGRSGASPFTVTFRPVALYFLPKQLP